MFPCGIVNSQIKPYRFKCTHTSHRMDVTFVSLFRRYFMFHMSVFAKFTVIHVYTVAGSCSTATCFSKSVCFIHVFFSSEHQSCYQVPSTQWAAEDCVSKAQRLVDVAICSGLTVCEVRPTSKGKEQKKHVSAREQMIYVLGWKNWRFIFHSAYLAMGVVPTMRQSPSFKGEKEWDLQCPCPGVHWGYDTEVAWASGTRGHAPKSKCSMTRLHYLLFDTNFSRVTSPQKMVKGCNKYSCYTMLYYYTRNFQVGDIL